MRIDLLLQRPAPCCSFEFFPPKTPEGEAQLWETLHNLAALQPQFVSVTQGGGDAAGHLTLQLVTRIQQQTGIEAMAHLTCMGKTRQALAHNLHRLLQARVSNILALRGDGPKGGQGEADGHGKEDNAAGACRYGSELVAFIRQQQGARLCIGGAAYPEVHLEAPSKAVDLQNLKVKVEAGCDFLITQLFFDNAFYFDFVRRARAVGIAVPILPGIMPITNYRQAQRMLQLCGVALPAQLQRALEKNREDSVAVLQLGVAHATKQCVELLARGAPGIHFYTLNKNTATRMIVTALLGNGMLQHHRAP